MTKQILNSQDEMIVLSFNIGDQIFGVDIFDITSVTRISRNNLYSIPKASDEVLGMCKSADEVFPIFDLQQLLNNIGFEFRKIEEETISVIKVRVKGFTSGLGLETEPDFESIIKSNLSNSTFAGIKSIWKTEVKEILIIDLLQLFPNVKVVNNKVVAEKTPGEEELDLSQYLLED